MEDSIFTKIINGEISCQKIYEDENTLAFLDIHPIQPGHTLVVPKRQVPFVWDLEEQEYQALMSTVHKVGKRLREAFPDKQRVGVIIEGLDVENHAHVKIFPFDRGQYREIPDMQNPANNDDLEAMAEKLRFQ